MAKAGVSERDKNYNEVKRDFINEYKGARSDIWNKKESRNGIVSYQNLGDNPPWMKGDANYGGVTAGIYNDDEVLQGSGDPKLLKTNANFYGTENLQGSRARDWELNEDTGKYQLKDGALTLSNEEWNSLEQEEKRQYMLNGVNPGKDNPKAKISYPDEKTEDEFTSGSDESVRINERKI